MATKKTTPPKGTKPHKATDGTFATTKWALENPDKVEWVKDHPKPKPTKK